MGLFRLEDFRVLRLVKRQRQREVTRDLKGVHWVSDRKKVLSLVDTVERDVIVADLAEQMLGIWWMVVLCKISKAA